MSRPLRMDYPDTFYHVLSRGNEKRDIYYDERDYFRFLDCLEQMVGRFNLEIHAYVLMKNHYHLLIRTKEANLSQAIQWLGVSYSVWFNRRHERSGHLFQGRFKSFLIEDDRYFIAMCHYIHGNPFRAGLVRRLWDYRWSSYRNYVDQRFKVPWLTVDLVLEMYGGSQKQFLKAQEISLCGDENILNELKHGLYLGSEEFGQLCLERVKRESYREQPQGRLLFRQRDIRIIALKILERLGEKNPESVLKVRKHRCYNRDVAIYILYQLGVYRNEEIGNVFGVGYTAIPGAVKRARAYLDKDQRLENTTNSIIYDI